jgi:flagellar motor switch protein FliG
LNSLASHAENESRRAAALRRIAIVLRDLPESVAAKLLGDLPPESRQRVRHEVMTLVDVDPMEHRRALESFTGSLRRGATRQSEQNSSRLDSPDEISFMYAAAASHSSVESSAPAKQPSSSLAFLDKISNEDLLTLLRDEHPQTKAVVLAQIQPARAAALLPKLGGAQRQDLLMRIGRLHTLPEEMLTDLASSFRDRVDHLVATRQKAAPQNIVPPATRDRYAHIPLGDPATAAQYVPAAAAAVSPRLQAILAEMPNVAPERHQTVVTVDEVAESTAERLRRITRDAQETKTIATPASSSHGASSASQNNPNLARATNPSTDEIHQELVGMSPRKLCESLGRVSTRTAILALCGLPNKVADAAIDCLPRVQANQVRQQLMAVGNLEIREIDQAKEAVANAARVVGQLNTSAASVAAPLSQSGGRIAMAM